MARHTFMAQRAVSKVWLDRELPLTTDGAGTALSAAGVLTGTLPQGWDAAHAVADQLPVILERGTIIHVDADGVHRGAYLVHYARPDAAGRLVIQAAGFSSYLHGIPYEGELVRVNVDPAAIARELWAHAQAHPDGNLGVQVLGSTSVRLGTGSDAREAEAAAELDAAKEAKEATVAELKRQRDALADLRKEYTAIVAEVAAAVKAAGSTAAKEGARNAGQVRKDQKQAQIDAQAAVVENRKKADAAARDRVTARTADRKTAKDQAKADGGAYRLNWWETPDCGSEFNSLAADAPFDWVERTAWDGENARLWIEIGYPRIGRRRHDLAFVEGENIALPVQPERDGAEFANAVIALGAGEGKGALRHSAAVRDGRLRTVHVLPAKDVGKRARLETLTRAELARRRTGALRVPEITVRDHPSAPIGSWQDGDDIRVQANVPHFGEIDEWFRVVTTQPAGEHAAVLRLERADSFNYGS